MTRPRLIWLRCGTCPACRGQAAFIGRGWSPRKRQAPRRCSLCGSPVIVHPSGIDHGDHVEVLPVLVLLAK